MQATSVCISESSIAVGYLLLGASVELRPRFQMMCAVASPMFACRIRNWPASTRRREMVSIVPPRLHRQLISHLSPPNSCLHRFPTGRATGWRHGTKKWVSRRKRVRSNMMFCISQPAIGCGKAARDRSRRLLSQVRHRRRVLIGPLGDHCLRSSPREAAST